MTKNIIRIGSVSDMERVCIQSLPQKRFGFGLHVYQCERPCLKKVLVSIVCWTKPSSSCGLQSVDRPLRREVRMMSLRFLLFTWCTSLTFASHHIGLTANLCQLLKTEGSSFI